MSVDAGHLDKKPLVVCVILSMFVAALRLGPTILNPSQYLVGGWGHPDNLGNHWLLVWVAERLLAGESILHNSSYYVPIGDHPWLAGNGSEGILFTPFYWLFGWPVGVVPLVVMYFIGIGLGGYSIAFKIGMERWSALIGSTVLTTSGFWVREMNAGRFSQLDGMWLLLSLGLFIGACTQKQSRLWVLANGICIGLTGLFYWYYAYFFVLAALCMVVCAALCKLPIQWKQILLAAGMSWVTIAPVGYIFWKYWAWIPGVDEAVFPAPDAFADAMTLSGSLLTPFGRTAGAVQALPTLVLALIGCMQFRRLRGVQRWGLMSALLCCLVFGILAFGPKAVLFEWVYGWSGPLRRFWWPSRHLVMWSAGCSVLASLGAKSISAKVEPDKQGVVAIGLSLLIPAFLWIQGDRPFHANHTPVGYPLTSYELVSKLEGDVVMMPPINPKVANTQLPLLFQLTHQKRLLTGHGMWVDRVRPPEWDEFVERNAILSTLSKYEVGDATTLVLETADIDVLKQQGIDLVVLDAKLFPRPMMGLVPNLASIYTSLFGEPILRGDQLRVWAIQNWTGVTEVELPKWTVPPNITLGDGRHKLPNPVVGRGVK